MVKSNIFYSWQSDLPSSTNRSFILDALEGAAKDVKRDDEIVVEPVIDRDTAGVAGSPDIGITILSKIDAAAAFVCDVSVVTTDAAGRPSPNPNVLVELGYAMKALGHGRIVLVMNTTFGPPEKLPFDLRQKRVTTYELPAGVDKTQVRKELRATLGAAIKVILREHQEAATRGAPAVSTQGSMGDGTREAAFWAMEIATRVRERAEIAFRAGDKNAIEEGPLLAIAARGRRVEGNVVFVRLDERMGTFIPDRNARDGVRVRTLDGRVECIPMSAVTDVENLD
jgi:hypothetical protein